MQVRGLRQIHWISGQGKFGQIQRGPQKVWRPESTTGQTPYQPRKHDFWGVKKTTLKPWGSYRPHTFVGVASWLSAKAWKRGCWTPLRD